MHQESGGHSCWYLIQAVAEPRYRCVVKRLQRILASLLLPQVCIARCSTQEFGNCLASPLAMCMGSVWVILQHEAKEMVSTS
jgi:hypothetical protein